jgi:elongation factor P
MLDRTFNAGIKVEQAILEQRDMQVLYKDGDDYVFMDTETYDQVNIKPVALGDAAEYLVENAVAIIATHDTEIVSVEIPASVELEVTLTEPGVQGDRVSGARKPATVQTGKVIQVPLFINIGDRVKVDTRSGEYLTRV